jgi:uncharacterized membrane protein
MRILILSLLCVTVLSGCIGPKTPQNQPSPYPSTPLGVSNEISTAAQKPTGWSYIAKWTEPFWSVTVKPGTAVISRPTDAKVEETSFITTEDDKWGIIIVRSVKGDFFLNMTKWSCSDGMSETKYDYNATVLVWAESLTGCALKVQ